MRRLFGKLIKIVAVAVVLAFVFLFGASLYLSPQDDLKKADMIVVVSGGDTDARLNEGIRLYSEGYAPKILFSGAAAEGEISNARAMMNIAIEEGVAIESILVEETSKTTEENALNSAVIMGDDYNSIILVTSPYHQRRAYETFSDALGENVEIINHSAVDHDWRKADWWSSEKARFLTVGEILKNLYFQFE